MNILYVNSLEANNKELRQQLAAALAAVKLKDEVLAAWGNLTTTEWLRVVAKVLAVQPDDSALKAWLGGPVGEVESLDIDEDGQPSAWVRMHVDLELGDCLYHPKELK